MKIYISLIFYFFSLSFSFSQSTFQYMYKSPLEELSKSLMEDELGNIYFPVDNSLYGLIIKLDHEGSFVDSIQIINPEGICSLSELIKIDQDHFVALGYWSCDSTSELWYVLFNNNLQVLDDKRLNSDGYKIFDFRHIINHKGNIVFLALYMAPQTYYKECIYEITSDGTIVRNRFFNSFSFNEGFTLLENSPIFSYKVFSFFPLGSKGFSFLNVLDTNFNVIDTVSFNEYINDLNTAKWINESTYLLTGKMYTFNSEEWDMGILKVSSTDSILSSAYFGKTDTVEWPGIYKNLDFISLDNIFYAGSSNSYMFPFQNEPSWIMLNIIDSDLNLKNQRFYGGDAFYLVNAILATQDSGCVLSCSRYDYLTQNEEFDIYILKVNQDGLLVSTPENPIINTNTCHLHPNPGNETLNVNSPIDRLQLQLFDLTGRLECEAELSTGTNSMYVSGLPRGIYLYRILDKKNQTVQSGKWMKN